MVILLTPSQALQMCIYTHSLMCNLSGVTLLFFLTVFRDINLGQMPHTCILKAMQNYINGSQHGP